MLKIDLHTHSIASIHAFSTIKEMADEAAKNGVEVLGITDHGPACKGDSPSVDYFLSGRDLPKKINGVRILFGVEANILDENGKIDLDKRVLERLDFVIAGLHRIAEYKDLGIDKNTDGIINAMKNPYVKIISHPYDTRNGCAIDIKKIAQAACDQNKLLEINSSYFYLEKTQAKKIHARMKKMIKIFKKNGKKILVTSDAHSAYNIGRDKELREKFGYLGLTDDDLLNNDVDAVLEYLGVEK